MPQEATPGDGSAMRQEGVMDGLDKGMARMEGQEPGQDGACVSGALLVNQVYFHVHFQGI